MNEIEISKETTAEPPKETPKESISTQPSIQNNKDPQPSSPRRFKTLIIILGIATFWPIFCIGTALALWVLIIINMFAKGWDAPSPPATLLIELLTKQLAYLAPIFFYFTIILAFILPFIYIINVFKNEWISKNKKAWWAIIFSLGVLFPLLIVNFLLTKNGNFFNIMFLLGIFIFTPYIAMPVYWYRHICKERGQNQSSGTRFCYIYIPILYFAAFLIIPAILIGTEIFTSVQGTNLVKKRESLMNGPIKVYMPTSLGNEWGITNNRLTADNGFREIEYFQLNGYKKINIAEIKSPETDLKCNNETFVELHEILPLSYLLPISEELWMKNCEELSTYGKKSVISEDKERHYRHFLMVFDKENTRILLDYFDQLDESLSNTQGLSKGELIKVAESLRPVN